MFNNIGGKIKFWAKVVCWAGIVISVITGLSLIATGIVADSVIGILAGFFTPFIGAGLSWVGSLFIYGFGQLIENTDIMVQTNYYQEDNIIDE